jgi:outer membrane immunogenic protein
MRFWIGRNIIIAICVGIAGGAAAADLPLRSAAPAVPPATTWAGFYIGGQVGYGNDSVRWRNLGASPFFSPPGSVTRDSGGGVIGGGQLGYNFQYNRFVLGVEGSISLADFDRSFTSPYFPATDVWSSRVRSVASATGRVGYSFGDWLPYVKGGFAAANVDTSIQNNGFGISSQASGERYGWTAGGGVEVKVAPKVSLGLEFMHTDLGRHNDINGPQTVNGAALPGTSESYGVAVRSNSIMGRLNYLFGR